MTDAFLVLPGGGYHGLADHECEPYADWLRSLGIAAEVFRYPVLTRHPGPLEAVRAEVRRVRAAGAERVGVIGSSAGGHAAGLAALDPGDPDSRIDIAILCYPVVSMIDGHEGSRRNLLGEDADEALREATSLHRIVTPDAPPFFLWHTAEDQGVLPIETYRLATALAAEGIPHEAHVFENGPHGVGLARDIPGTCEWTTLAADWLRRHGWGA